MPPVALLLLGLLSLLLASCETALDPRTGQSQTRLTLPLTEANAAAQQERWQRCVAFRSESFCERNVPGGRPHAAGSPVVDDYPEVTRQDP